MSATLAGLTIPPVDLCHVQWRSLAWVLEHGPITAQNAMDYFSLSPFYDRRSTNQVLRMQSMFSGQPPLEPQAEKEALKKLIGLEYVLVTSKPEAERDGGLFVVEKRDRRGPEETYPVASYYILKTSIYQSPSVHGVLSSRLLTSLSSLSELLTLARSHKPVYNARQGYGWQIKDKADADADATTPDSESDLDLAERPCSPMRTKPDPSTIAMDLDRPEPTYEIKPTDGQTKSDPSELFNPLLFRAIQNTAASGFLAPKPIVEAVSTEAPTEAAISVPAPGDSESQEHASKLPPPPKRKPKRSV